MRPPHLVLRDRLVRQLAAANALGSILIVGYLILTSPFRHRAGARWAQLGRGFMLLGAMLVVFIPAAIWWADRHLVPRLAWLSQPDRVPTAEERSFLTGFPWWSARMVMPFYVTGGVVAAAFSVATGAYADGARIFAGTVLGALSILAVTYLIVERSLRPFFPRALGEGHPARAGTVDIRRRLLLAWVLGSGIPVGAIAVIPLGRRGAQFAPLGAVVVAMSVLALLAGAGLTVAAADALAAPVDEVTEGLERVRAGNLGAEVPVNDTGQIGNLQAGFNEMVAGLRERQRIEDLFGRHVGTEVAQQAMEQGLQLRGEERTLSAVFVDLIGSTTITEAKSPTQVVEMLNQFFNAVVESVNAQGGWVNKFEGDAALCVFGAPATQPDHADRALAAVRTLRDRLQQLRAEHPEMDAGIGVATGRAVAGNIGAEQRYEYTVIGLAVNEAARLAELAKTRPARVLASASTLAASSGGGGWVPAGEVELRGFSAPRAVHTPI